MKMREGSAGHRANFPNFPTVKGAPLLVVFFAYRANHFMDLGRAVGGMVIVDPVRTPTSANARGSRTKRSRNENFYIHRRECMRPAEAF